MRMAVSGVLNSWETPPTNAARNSLDRVCRRRSRMINAHTRSERQDYRGHGQREEPRFIPGRRRFRGRHGDLPKRKYDWQSDLHRPPVSPICDKRGALLYPSPDIRAVVEEAIRRI